MGTLIDALRERVTWSARAWNRSQPRLKRLGASSPAASGTSSIRWCLRCGANHAAPLVAPVDAEAGRIARRRSRTPAAPSGPSAIDAKIFRVRSTLSDFWCPSRAASDHGVHLGGDEMAGPRAGGQGRVPLFLDRSRSHATKTCSADLQAADGHQRRAALRAESPLARIHAAIYGGACCRASRKSKRASTAHPGPAPGGQRLSRDRNPRLRAQREAGRRKRAPASLSRCGAP